MRLSDIELINEVQEGMKKFDKLAIDGGPKVITESLPTEWPGVNWIGDEERQAVAAAVDGQSHTGNLADDLCEFYGCAWSHPTNSGTAALFTAAATLGIGPGMEVLIPGICWLPTFACVVSRGAIPVLVEVGEDLGMDPNDMRRKITPRTRAVIPVHMCGAPADMDPIMAVAREHDLLVFEDCAQAGAVTYKGKHVGLFGDIGCFSLQQNKHFTCFTGGYILSNRQELKTVAMQINDAGLTRIMDVGSEIIDDVVEWGMGHYLNVLAQAMAREQLKKVPKILGAMRHAKNRIKDGIKDSGIRCRPLNDPEGDGGSFLVTYWPSPEIARRAAEAIPAEGGPQWTYPLESYGTHMYYYMLNLIRKAPWLRGTQWPWDIPENRDSVYSYEKGALPQSDQIFSHGVVMAVPSRLTDEQCDKIAEIYVKITANHAIH